MRIFNYIELYRSYDNQIVCRLSIDNLTDNEILDADEKILKEMGSKYYTQITASTHPLERDMNKGIKGGLMKFVNPKYKSRRAKT